MKIFTVQQAALQVGVSEQHMRKLIKDKVVKATRLGKRKYGIPESELDNLKSDKDKTKDMEKQIEEFARHADAFIASPDTIEQLKEAGMPIKSVFTTYEQYVDKLFSEKRKVAGELIWQLPRLKENIANSTVAALYEELKETFILGINGASIVLGIMLLEISAKFRLYEEMKKMNASAKWESVEDMYLIDVIKALYDPYKVINPDELKELEKFNYNVRNNYFHYNIQKLIKGMVLLELPSFNIRTGKIAIEKNVEASDRPFLWFSAKRVLDRQTVVSKISFCVQWVNHFFS